MRLLKKMQSGPALVRDSSRRSGTSEDAVYEYEGESYYNCVEWHLHAHAHALGGLGCHDQKLQEDQQRAIGEWVATLGKKLFTGGGLGSTPAPVAIFEPRSNLQKLTDCWVYTSLLQRAAAAPDSVTRLQYTAAWFVAGLRHAFDTWCKPFNPVLGETWQSATSSGCEAFLEQVSHHPPVAAFALEGEGFRLHGSAELQISVNVKHRGFKQTMKGDRTIKFAGGDVIDFVQMPAFVTKGVVGTGELRGDVEGRAILRLKGPSGTYLLAHLNFGPQAGATTGLYSRTDAVSGHIVQVDGLASPSDSARSEVASELGLCSDSGTADSAELSARGSVAAVWPRRKADPQTPSCSDKLESSGGFMSSVSSMSNFFGVGGPAVDDAAVPADALGVFQGNWLSHLSYASRASGRCEDAECLWSLHEAEREAFVTLPQARLLPSDCTFREDMRLLALGDLKGAEAAKQVIEDKQRRERKLRAKKR